MIETSDNSDQATFPGMSDATSSPASVDGTSPSTSPDGKARSGQPRYPASPSPSPGEVSVKKMKDTFFLISQSSSPSAVLQSFLESKLLQRLDVNGSPEYVLKWKCWDIPSGPPICALRASGRRTSGKDCTGWPTPQNRMKGGGGYSDPEKAIKRWESGRQKNLNEAALMVVEWPTPDAQAMNVGCDPEKHQGRRDKLKKKWGNSNGAGKHGEGGQDLLTQAVGVNPNSSLAETASKGAFHLNHLFSLWLQGYPEAWAKAAPGRKEYDYELRRTTEKYVSKGLETPLSHDLPPSL